MRRQVMRIEYNGRWKVIHDDSKKFNPFIVYYETWKDGRLHRNKVVEYADFASCIAYFKAFYIH